VTAVDWIEANAYWIFSGIGAIAVSSVVAFVWKRQRDAALIQSQRAGHNSVLIQVGEIKEGERKP
jgi:hypothetical protein